MSDTFVIIPKPDDISWERVTEVLRQAHQSTKDAGMDYAAYSQTPEQIEQRIRGGMCFICISDDKVVGTATITPELGNKWYCNEGYALFQMLGVLPEYKGKKLGRALYSACEEWAESKGFKVIIFNTAKSNIIMRKGFSKYGFRHVDYSSHVRTNYYSVVLAKYLVVCSHLQIYYWIRFNLSRIRCILVKDSKGKTRKWVGLIKKPEIKQH